MKQLELFPKPANLKANFIVAAKIAAFVLLVAAVVFLWSTASSYVTGVIATLKSDINGLKEKNVEIEKTIDARTLKIQATERSVDSLKIAIQALTIRQSELKASLIKIKKQYETRVQTYRGRDLNGRVDTFYKLLPNR